MAQKGQGDQFYVTHCTTADSVLNNPGYTVRAASDRDDTDTLSAAFRYPPYELPIDMWRDSPAPGAAPRRLARTHGPRNRVWAVHSTFVAKDTVDRDRSYFSHLFLLNDAPPDKVLESWGADKWAKTYPQGATQELPGADKLPKGNLVSEEALTAFLGERPPGGADLATTVCPTRLRASADARRDALARVIQAVLLRAEEENESRNRLYIHAEPGVVALLLYGAVRLLPAEITEDLTFSTFEPYHRNIRDYKLADVVGTYLGAPDKGLDADLGTTRGIALDLIVPARSSPALRGPVRELLTSGVSELIDLAARGEWGILGAVHAAIDKYDDPLPRAPKAILRARLLAKVDDGRASIDELLALQEEGAGANDLRERADTVLPVVMKIALDPRHERCAVVREKFGPLLAENAQQLWNDGFGAIKKKDEDTWETRWALLHKVAPAAAEKLLKKSVGSEKNEETLTKLPTYVRDRMRDAYQDVKQLPPRALLVPIGMGELEPLLKAPPDWAGYTAFVLLASDKLGWLAHVPEPDRLKMRKRAREFLFAAPAPAVAAYVHAARPYLDTDPRFLTVLFKPYSPAAAALMDKLLTTTTLDPGDWMKLCTHVRLAEAEWGEFLLEKGRLASLLVGLGGDGTGREVWDAYLGLLTQGLVSPDLITTNDGTEPAVVHAWERNIHNQLKVAAERLAAAGYKQVTFLPTGGVARLQAANNLMTWVNNPGAAAGEGHEELKHACERFGVDKMALVRVAYKKGGYDKLDLPTEIVKLDPILSLFRTAFPVDQDSQYHTVKSAVNAWLKLSLACPQPSRGAFQARLVLQAVDPKFYSNLLGEPRHDPPFDPKAVAYITQAPKKAAPKPPPLPASPFEVVPDAPKKAAPKPPPRPRTTAPEPQFEDEDEPEPVGPEPDAPVSSMGDGELPAVDLAEARTSTKPRESGGGSSRGGDRGRSRPKKDNTKKVVIIGGVVILALVGAIIGILMLMGPDETAKQGTQPSPPTGTQPTKPTPVTPKPDPKPDPKIDPKIDPKPDPKPKPWTPETYKSIFNLGKAVRYGKPAPKPKVETVLSLLADTSAVFKLGLPVRYPKPNPKPDPKVDPKVGAVPDFFAATSDVFKLGEPVGRKPK